jgi:hypothetical protein
VKDCWKLSCWFPGSVQCTQLTSLKILKIHIIPQNTLVVDITVSFANILVNFQKYSKWSYWDTQGPWGNWSMKKTWSWNSRVRLPLKNRTSLKRSLKYPSKFNVIIHYTVLCKKNWHLKYDRIAFCEKKHVT